MAVELGHELAQLVGRAVPARRREVPRALVAPRIVERVLRDRHQLDVREPKVLDVGGELPGDLAVPQEIAGRVAAPRAQMHLVDRDRLREPVALRALFEPRRVVPAERRRRRRDRGRRRPLLERRAVRVGLELQLAAVARVELVLVELAGADLGHEQLPDARAAAHAHRVIAPVPVIERADDADALGVRRPDGEADAAHAGDRALVSAEEAMRVDVTAAREACEVALVDLERERVRVVALVPTAVVRLPANAIRRRDVAARPLPLEQRRPRNARELDGGLEELHPQRVR